MSAPSRVARWAALLPLLLLAVPASAPGAVSVVPTPNPGTANTIGGLIAFGPADVWGVGASSASSYTGCHGRTLTIRSTGGAFIEVPETPAPTPICATVASASGVATNDIWAVGSINSARDVHIRHYNGSQWSVSTPAFLQPPPAGARRLRTTGLNAVTAVAGNDVWAAGRAEYSDSVRRAIIEHWNGSAWSLVSGPTTSGSVINGLYAQSATNVWAVGANGAGGTLATRWNGSAWTTVATPNANTLNKLAAVSGTSPSDVWAVGSSIRSTTDGVSQYRTLIEHFNGTSWSVVPSPNVGTMSNELTGVAARSATDVWAVGYRLQIFGFTPTAQTLWLHYNGTSWSVVPSPNVAGDNLLAGVITPAGSSDAWAWGGSAAGTLVERVTP